MSIHTLNAGQIKSPSGLYLANNGGWKIHLSADPKDHAMIYEYLSYVEFGSKYGHNSGQSGKDFTVYIGAWDDCERFAHSLDGLEKLLSYPSGDALRDDLWISPKVGARFDTLDPRFQQYGSKGIPYLKDDAQIMLWGDFKKDPIGHRHRFIEHAYNTLNKKFGQYFRGSHEQVTKFVCHILNDEVFQPFYLLEK